MPNFDELHERLKREIKDMLRQKYPTYNTLPPDMQELLYNLTHDIILLIMDMRETKETLADIDETLGRIIQVLKMAMEGGGESA